MGHLMLPNQNSLDTILCPARGEEMSQGFGLVNNLSLQVCIGFVDHVEKNDS